MENDQTVAATSKEKLGTTILKSVVAASIGILASGLAEKGFDKLVNRRRKTVTEDQ